MINPQPVYGNRSPYSQPSRPQFPPNPGGNKPLPPKSPKSKRHWKRILGMSVVAIVVSGGVFMAANLISLKNNIIEADDNTKHAAILEYDPNKKDQLDPSKFTHIGDGRFNMVLVGIDKAASLTDSIQIISVDTITKESSITSIPRDLYVTVPGHGRQKINAAYKLAESSKAGSGSAVLKEVVGNVLGTTITNYALIDFKGLESLVDSLGGIEVTVTQPITDPFFPAETGDGYAPFSIKAGTQKLDGKTALRYARSRKTTSDFDRARRQQQVIEAIRSKALSAGVLTNPVKITNTMQSLGKSFKTDLEVGQIKSLLSIYNSIPNGSNKSLVLDTTEELGLLTSSSNTSAGYINFPILGYDRYTDLNRWYRKNNPDPLLKREQPTITLAAGGKTTDKQLKDMQALLTDYGYTVTLYTGTVPKSASTSATTLVELKNNAKPISRNYLSSQFGVSAQGKSLLGGKTDFEIIYIPAAVTTQANVPAAKQTATPKSSVAPAKTTSTPPAATATPVTTPVPTPTPTATPLSTPTPSPSPEPEE